MQQGIMKNGNGSKLNNGTLWKYFPRFFTPSYILPFSFILLLTASVLLTAASPKHDYHVSVTQMQYNPGSKVFELSIRIFTDDLERALAQANNNKRFSINNKDQNDTYVSAYLQQRFSLRDAQKRILPLRYVGKEQEEDATWVYLEIPFQLPFSGNSLQNSILTEIFDDQVNMTNVILPSGKKTYLFKKGQLTYTL